MMIVYLFFRCDQLETGMPLRRVTVLTQLLSLIGSRREPRPPAAGPPLLCGSLGSGAGISYPGYMPPPVTWVRERPAIGSLMVPTP